MMQRRLAWDDAKARVNLAKHGIGFAEAALVFDDPLHLSVLDRVENGEPRWQTVGTVGGVVVILVAHTVAEGDEDGTPVETIRIISARKATRRERRRYEEG